MLQPAAKIAPRTAPGGSYRDLECFDSSTADVATSTPGRRAVPAACEPAYRSQVAPLASLKHLITSRMKNVELASC